MREKERNKAVLDKVLWAWDCWGSAREVKRIHPFEFSWSKSWLKRQQNLRLWTVLWLFIFIIRVCSTPQSKGMRSPKKNLFYTRELNRNFLLKAAHCPFAHWFLFNCLAFICCEKRKTNRISKKTIHGHIEIRATFRAENVNYFLGSKNLNVEHRFLTYLIDDGRRSIFPQILHELWTTNRSLWQSNEIYLFWMVKERRLKKAK